MIKHWEEAGDSNPYASGVICLQPKWFGRENMSCRLPIRTWELLHRNTSFPIDCHIFLDDPYGFIVSVRIHNPGPHFGGSIPIEFSALLQQLAGRGSEDIKDVPLRTFRIYAHYRFH